MNKELNFNIIYDPKILDNNLKISLVNTNYLESLYQLIKNIYTDSYNKSFNNLKDQINLLSDNILPSLKSNKDINIAKEIRLSIDILKFYKLNKSIKFCSELLISHKVENLDTNNTDSSISKFKIFKTKKLNFEKSNNRLNYSESTEKELYSFFNSNKNYYEDAKDILDYAITLYELKEYKKCFYYLSQYANINNEIAWFYYIMSYKNYLDSYYLSSNNKFEDFNQILGQKRSAFITSYNDLSNNELYVNDINSNIIEKLSKHENDLNPVLCYLYASLLHNILNKTDKAIKFYIKSINSFPLLWSAWSDLCKIISSNNIKCYGDEFDEYNEFDKNFCKAYKNYLYLFPMINNTWVKYIYLNDYLILNNFNEFGIKLSSSLISNNNALFTNNYYLKNLIAVGYFQNKNFKQSLTTFKELFNMDPYRYECINYYSSALFLLNSSDLSKLAFDSYNLDRFKYETNIAISNFYASEHLHEECIYYLNKAILIEEKNIEAWIMLSHEYIECKDFTKSIECLSKAVKYDKNNSVVWLNLAYIYLIHDLDNFAIYYYYKAFECDPFNIKPIISIADCYFKKNNFIQSISYFHIVLEILNKNKNLIDVKEEYLLSNFEFYTSCYNKLGICYANLDKITNSVYYFNLVFDPVINIDEDNKYTVKSLHSYNYIKKFFINTEDLNNLILNLIKYYIKYNDKESVLKAKFYLELIYHRPDLEEYIKENNVKIYYDKININNTNI